jgi:hypothetical protein
VFTARYGLCLYITNIRFVFTGLISHWIELSGQIHAPFDLAGENSPPFPIVCETVWAAVGLGALKGREISIFSLELRHNSLSFGPYLCRL